MSATPPAPNEPKRYVVSRGRTTLANLVRLEGRMLDKPEPITKKRPRRRRK